MKKQIIKIFSIHYFSRLYSIEANSLFNAIASIHLASKVCNNHQNVLKFIVGIEKMTSFHKYSPVLSCLASSLNLTKENRQNNAENVFKSEIDLITHLGFCFEIELPSIYFEFFIKRIISCHLKPNDFNEQELESLIMKSSSRFFVDMYKTRILFSYDPRIIAESIVTISLEALHIKYDPIFFICKEADMVIECVSRIKSFFANFGVSISNCLTPYKNPHVFQKFEKFIVLKNFDEEPLVDPPDMEQMRSKTTQYEDGFSDNWITRIPQIEPPSINLYESMKICSKEKTIFVDCRSYIGQINPHYQIISN